MSASTERKNAAREAGTDKKMLARQEAEKKAAKSRRRWTIGSILVAIGLIVIILLNSGFLYKHTTALSVGGRNYSPAELSYTYVNQYSSFLNQYGSYASLFGLDTSQGVASLSQQSCPMLDEGKTWRDYFLENAGNNLQQVTVLKNYADQNGITLDESELAALDDEVAALEEAARSYGYSNANRFLAAQYGTGVNVRLARDLMAESTLATKVMQSYSDSLSFSDEELEEYYASLEGSSDLFDYASYFVAAEALPVEGAETEDQTAPTEQTRLEARMTAEAIEMAYQDGYDIDDPAERLNAAIEAEYDAGSATVRSGVSGGSLGDLSDWLRDGARQAGDVGVIEAADGSGYTVAVFLSREDNHYPTVSVRHILIKAAAPRPTTAPTPTRPRKPRSSASTRSRPSSNPATRARRASPRWRRSTPRTPARTRTAACTRAFTAVRWCRSSTTSASPATRAAISASSTARTAATPATTWSTSSARARITAARSRATP